MYSIESLSFEGPYGRYNRAVHDNESDAVAHSTNQWVIKLRMMLRQREAYIKAGALMQYKDDWPLFACLFEVYEDHTPGSLKHLIEAALCTEASFKQIASLCFGIRAIDDVFIAVYSELFYNIKPYLGNHAAIYRYVVTPMLRADTNKLATEHVWKMLALTGGIDYLITKGLGTVTIKPTDMDYMLQAATYRNISMAIKYSAAGLPDDEDGVSALPTINLMTKFMELAMSRQTTPRDGTGMAFIEAKPIETGYGDLLSNIISMNHINKYALEDATPDMKIEGTHDPRNAAACEVCRPVSYLEQDSV